MRIKIKTTKKKVWPDGEEWLFYMAKLTEEYWCVLDDDSTIELWRVFRLYYALDFCDDIIPIPPYLKAIWELCRRRIDAWMGNRKGSHQ